MNGEWVWEDEEKNWGYSTSFPPKTETNALKQQGRKKTSKKYIKNVCLKDLKVEFYSSREQPSQNI